MPIPTCVKCEIGMVLTKSGVFLVEMFGDPPRPYKIWHADLRTCQRCGNEITTGYTESPLMEHFEEGFGEWLEMISGAKGATVIYQYEELY